MSKWEKIAVWIGGGIAVNVLWYFFYCLGRWNFFSAKTLESITSWAAGNIFFIVGVIFILILGISLLLVYLAEKATDKRLTRFAKEIAREVASLLKTKEAPSEQVAFAGNQQKKTPPQQPAKQPEKAAPEMTPKTPATPKVSWLAKMLTKFKTWLAGIWQIIPGNWRKICYIMALAISLVWGGYYYCKCATLEKQLKLFVDTNAFAKMFGNLQEVSGLFGIPQQEIIDTFKVSEMNSEKNFVNTYCQFHQNQAGVEARYKSLLSKYPKAQRCATEMSSSFIPDGDGEQMQEVPKPAPAPATIVAPPEKKEQVEQKQPEPTKPEAPVAEQKPQKTTRKINTENLNYYFNDVDNSEQSTPPTKKLVPDKVIDSGNNSDEIISSGE